MRNQVGDKQRLQHILKAISEIENYTEGASLSSFLENSMMRFACIKQIEIIGEAANLVTESTKAKFSEIEWGQIIGMRHVLVHEYFGIDEYLIWQVIIKDIPTVKEKLKEAIETLESE